MSWTKKTASDTANVERIVNRSIHARRCLGYKSDHAMADAALALGTTPRRVRSIVRRELFHFAVDEYRQMLRRWWADMDRQAAELYAEANRLQKLADAEWSAAHQLSLPLEMPDAAGQSPHRQISDVAGRAAGGAGADDAARAGSQGNFALRSPVGVVAQKALTPLK